ncbi:MAG: DNA cytosine methyltransferase, partial [Sporichthyaceae bacterium]|nr:DNA cytosine methyltransferase [Sporichthyaceae bacterium]
MADLSGQVSPHAVSLFAGIGGVDLALHRAGIPVVASVELDPARRAVLTRHWPDLTLFNDVTEVSGEQLRDAGFDPGRGLVAAGWPCQDFSV